MSQVTKPMALDETLQDVVTAIQGITQGGMIVSTGNVGSATQPVYINGGVPTAMTGALAAVNGGTGDIYGKAPYVYIGKVTDADIPVQGTAEVNRRLTVSLISGTASNHAPTANWYTLYTASGSDTGGDYGSQVAVGVNVDAAYFRTKQGGTWGGWKQIYGIITGTPTNINSNCSLRSGGIVKSGNVVNLRIALNINTTFTPSSSTTLFKLPWTPALTYPQFDRVLEDSGSFYELGKSHADGANIVCGKASNYGVFTAGRIITINGTYITSD